MKIIKIVLLLVALIVVILIGIFILTKQSVSISKSFLNDLKISYAVNQPINAITKSVNFSSSKKEMAGFSIFVPPTLNTSNYFSSRGFKLDMDNSGDATFSGSSAVKNSQMICITQYRTQAPNNDYSKCDDKPNSICTQTAELFCADLSK